MYGVFLDRRQRNRGGDIPKPCIYAVGLRREPREAPLHIKIKRFFKFVGAVHEMPSRLLLEEKLSSQVTDEV